MSKHINWQVVGLICIINDVELVFQRFGEDVFFAKAEIFFAYCCVSMSSKITCNHNEIVFVEILCKIFISQTVFLHAMNDDDNCLWIFNIVIDIGVEFQIIKPKDFQIFRFLIFQNIFFRFRFCCFWFDFCILFCGHHFFLCCFCCGFCTFLCCGLSLCCAFVFLFHFSSYIFFIASSQP